MVTQVIKGAGDVEAAFAPVAAAMGGLQFDKFRSIDKSTYISKKNTICLVCVCVCVSMMASSFGCAIAVRN